MVRTSRGGLDMRLTVSILLMFIFINMWTIGPFEKDSPPILYVRIAVVTCNVCWERCLTIDANVDECKLVRLRNGRIE